MSFQAGGNAKVQSIRGCVLFDPKDGSIRHINRVITLEGAVATSEKDMETRTLRLAASLGLESASLQLLHVNHEAFVAGHQYKVDTKTRSLVEIAQKKTRRTGTSKKSKARRPHNPRRVPALKKPKR
jgi:hypothetical protein